MLSLVPLLCPCVQCRRSRQLPPMELEDASPCELLHQLHETSSLPGGSQAVLSESVLGLFSETKLDCGRRPEEII